MSRTGDEKSALPLRLNYALKTADFTAMMSSPYYNGRGRLKGKIYKALFIAFFFLGALLLWLDINAYQNPEQGKPEYWFVIWLAGFVGGTISRYLIMPIYYRWYFKSGRWDEPSEVVIDETGIDIKAQFVQSICQWENVIMAERTKRHFFIWISKVQAIIIPFWTLDTQEEIEALWKDIDAICGDERTMT